MIVLGFTVPGFINTDNSGPSIAVEPRLCQSDSGCYLICDDGPVHVLCSQNLCSQNSCEEYSYYAYNKDSLKFSLSVSVENEEFNLENRSDQNDIFVKFVGDNVDIYSRGLSLNQVLEKVSMGLSSTCLSIGTQLHCEVDNSTLVLLVNGNASYEAGNYGPTDNDVIQIIYS